MVGNEQGGVATRVLPVAYVLALLALPIVAFLRSEIVARPVCIAVMANCVFWGVCVGLEGLSPTRACARTQNSAESSAEECLAVHARMVVPHYSILYVFLDLPLRAVIPLEVARCGLTPPVAHTSVLHLLPWPNP